MAKLAVGGIALLFLFVLFAPSSKPSGSGPHQALPETKPVQVTPEIRHETDRVLQATSETVPETKSVQVSSEMPHETGRVFQVSDGDSITIVNATGKHKLRLAGIDAPELHQSFGEAARDYLRSLVPEGSAVSFEITETDKYNRGIAFVRAGELDVNLAMVTNGLAWSHVKFDRDHRFRKPQREASASKRGLWSEPDPMPPWDWKKAHPRE